jgi:hypothetical protein
MSRKKKGIRKSALSNKARKAEARKRRAKASSHDPQTLATRRYSDLTSLAALPLWRKLLQLKQEATPVLRAVLNNLPARYASALLVGLAFPQDVADLSHDVTSPNTGSVEAELTWLSFGLTRHTIQLKAYNRARTEFERSLLRGDYDQAGRVLDGIERNQGWSLWLIASQLLLAEQRAGLAANRDALARLKDAGAKGFVRLLADFLSQRAETSTSVANYNLAYASFEEQYPSDEKTQEALSYVRFKVHYSSWNDLGRMAYVLWRESTLSLIDSYNAFVRCLQALAQPKEEVPLNLQSCLRRVSDAFPEAIALRQLHRLFEPTLMDERTPVSDALYEALDAYTAGDYPKAIAVAHNGVVAWPDCFEFYEILCYACVHCAQDLPPLRDSLLKSIARHVLNVVSKNDETEASLELLRRLAAALDNSRFAMQLTGFIKSQEPQHDRRAPNYFAALSASAPTPRFARVFRDRAQSTAYLGSLVSAGRDGTTLQFFRACYGVSALPTNVPSTRTTKYQAYLQMEAENHEAAARLFKQLLLEPGTPTPVRESATCGLLECYLSLGNVDAGLKLLVDTYLESEHLLLSVDLGRILARAGESGDHVADPLSWTIIYWLHQIRAQRPIDEEAVFFAVERVLRMYEVERPSALPALVGTIGQAKLAIFLREICVPEILDYSFAFEGTDDLENERTRICQALLALDPSNGDLYSQEIFDLDKASMVRRVLRHLDASKVQVDMFGLFNSLGRPFQERYERYVSFVRLSTRQREVLRVQGIALDAPVFVVTDASLSIFEELFRDLRNRFLVSEHGLDSYLSIRIRHGTLSGQLRSRFEQERLITTRSAVDGTYDRNVYWSDRFFRAHGPDVDDRAMDILRDFSSRMDSAIDYLRSKVIQIRGPQNEDRGLFDFDYGEGEVGDLFAKSLRTETYEEFLKLIFDELWRRTRQCLVSVVKYLREDFRAELTRHLDRLTQDVNALDPGMSHSPFSDAVSRCRTQIQNELEAIASWFGRTSLDEGVLDSYDMRVVVESAVATAKKCFPTYGFDPELQLPENLRCKGSTLVPLEDILFILFSNIVKHSGLGMVDAKVSIRVVGDELQISVANKLAAHIDVSAVDGVIARLGRMSHMSHTSGAVGQIRAESGTGYYKLHKLLRYDLDLRDHVVSVSREGNEFRVAISFPLNAVVVLR